MIILGTNSIKDTGYNVANSARFNDGSSDYLSKSFSSGNQKTFTFSTWFKLGNSTDTLTLFATGADAENRFWVMRHNESSNNSQIKIDAKTSTSQTIELRTNASFRDPAAWMHLVVAVDTTQATDTNRVKVYINGSQVTSFNQSTYPAEDHNTEVNKAAEHRIGRYNAGDNYWDGYMCETVFIDGTQYAASDFGEFDSDSPTIWKPKDVSGLTFGTNGFYLDFEDSSALGNDVSGNNNDFTANNLTAVDQSTDTCTNNFSTMNPLSSSVSLSSFTYTEGNLEAESDARRGAYSNIGVSSGKWYVEAKLISFTNGGSGTNLYGIGVAADTFHVLNDGIGEQASAVAYLGTGTKTVANSTSSFGNTYTTNDIIGIALDLDNNKIYFSKNGTFQNSGDPTSGSTGTGAIGTVAVGSTPDGAYFFNSGHQENQAKWSFNFGSPAYAISSGNADGNGYGNFEYAVPSGYFSINTKNLAEHG